MFCLLDGVVIAGEWSVAGLSVLSHMHTPPANQTSCWAEMGSLHSLDDDAETLTPSRTFHWPFSIVVHPRAGTVVLLIFFMDRIFLGFDSRSELGAMYFHP